MLFVREVSMIYAIIMAVAFIAVVSLITILIVTKKKDEILSDSDTEDEYVAISPPASSPERDGPKPDRREMIFNGQKPDRDDFGYSETNPLCTSSVISTEKYLALLRTEEGEPLQWVREGTIAVKNLHHAGTVNVEAFSLYLHGKLYRQIFICPHGRNSTNVPAGLALAGNGVPSPYGGSILEEARQKGITEKQVLAKHALVYEESRTSRREQSTSGRSETSGTGVKPEPPSGIRTANSGNRPGNDNRAQQPVSKEPAASSSFPNYLPGFEPENVRPSLESFLVVMERHYPDHIIPESTWNHEKWDKAAAMLCKFLGYANGSEFLEAYGYTVEKDA